MLWVPARARGAPGPVAVLQDALRRTLGELEGADEPVFLGEIGFLASLVSAGPESNEGKVEELAGVSSREDSRPG